MNLAESLFMAQSDRARRASATLAHAATAPALFRPKYVDELIVERDRALAVLNSPAIL